MITELFEYLTNSSLIAMVAFLIPFILFMRRFKRNKNNQRDLKIDPKILQERINKFKPEPLVKPIDKTVENVANTVQEEGRFIIDLAKVNYLNLLNNKDVMQNAADCIKKYGVGTCGPRGFYGTTDIHLQLEKSLAEFLGTQQAIVFAYGFTTLSTCISAYCKKEDILFCDEHINFPLKQGILAAKSETIYFKHNDTVDLRRKLEENQLREKRKFLILEGVYEKTGTLCRLPDFVKLATEFQIRIFLDESISFGVVGVNGRGITEHFKIAVIDIDLIIGSLENSLGSIGGFCAGSEAVIEHQRLHSKGYTYSASLPTYLSEVAIKALPIVENNSIFLQILATKFQEFLCSIDNLKVLSDAISPLKIIQYCSKSGRSKLAEEMIYEYCRDHYVYLILSSNGITMHLNVELYFNEDRLARVFEVVSNSVLNVEVKG